MKNIFKFSEFINELRRNPHLNVKEDLYHQLMKFINVYKDEEDLLFLHFSNIIRPQFLNRSYEYSTPLAFYSYPLKNPHNNGLDFIGNIDESSYQDLKIDTSWENCKKIFNYIDNFGFFDFNKIDKNNYDQLQIREMFLECSHQEMLKKSNYTQLPMRKDGGFVLVDHLYGIENIDITEDMFQKYYIRTIIRAANYMGYYNLFTFTLFFELNNKIIINKKKSEEKLIEILDNAGIKYTTKTKIYFNSYFKEFTNSKYVYILKLKSLDKILIHETSTPNILKECAIKAIKYAKDNYDTSNEHIDYLMSKKDDIETLKHLFIFIEEIIQKNKSSLPKELSKEQLKIYTHCNIKGILSYNDSFIDEHIPNQLALFDVTLVEDFAFYTNDFRSDYF